MTHECTCHHASAVVLDEPIPRARPEQTVRDVARQHAGALQIMKEMGINHCCGAHLTLNEAAALAGVPVDALLAALNGPLEAPA